MANLEELIAGARDSITVKRVYGEPYEKDGVTLIPAAAVRGGGCAGEGGRGDEQPSGECGGFCTSARPVGAYRIKDGEVTWIPAADTTRVIVMAQVTAVVVLVMLRLRARRRRS